MKVCFIRFPHSEIPGSQVATHLPEAYRRYAASFIAFSSQGIHHSPLIEFRLAAELPTIPILTSYQCAALEIPNSKLQIPCLEFVVWILEFPVPRTGYALLATRNWSRKCCRENVAQSFHYASSDSTFEAPFRRRNGPLSICASRKKKISRTGRPFAYGKYAGQSP